MVAANLEARRSPTQETTSETEEAAAKEDAGIVPLGIPMLANPGAISSVMVLVGQAPSLWSWEMGAVAGAIPTGGRLFPQACGLRKEGLPGILIQVTSGWKD